MKPTVARQMWRTLEPYHVLVYLVPEAEQTYVALGLREGVDAAALYEVITHSAGNSWMFENRMAHVLAGSFPTGSRRQE